GLGAAGADLFKDVDVVAAARQLDSGEELIRLAGHLLVAAVEVAEGDAFDALGRGQDDDGVVGHEDGDAVGGWGGVDDVAGPGAAGLDLDGTDLACRGGEEGEFFT